MKYSTKPLLVCLLSGAILGCDPVSGYKKTFKNSSKYTLKIEHFTRAGELNPYQLQATYTMAPKSEILLDNGSGLNDAPPCVLFGDSLDATVTDQSDLKVNLDLNKENNWVRSQSGSRSKGYQVECWLVVEDANVVPK
ncbi:hypothetical protein ACTJIJ_14925 [Niabella sp. 22666]|uniref:hypothetical protein n=1 Tax=Niabella sp. 22666 TaxID=3453954 RepID=UPI003F87C377